MISDIIMFTIIGLVIAVFALAFWVAFSVLATTAVLVSVTSESIKYGIKKGSQYYGKK